MATIPDRLKAHLNGMRFGLMEASGAMGDLGTFIPITISLVAVAHLDIGTILLFAGLYNVLSGLLFNQPIPVQPMKAIAAVAIAEALSPGAIAAAGLGAGAVVLFLGTTGLLEKVERLIPRAIVRGIQLGVGLKLLMNGILMIGATPALALDGWITAGVAAVFIVAATGRARLPAALILFVAGLLVMLAINPGILCSLSLGWQGLSPSVPSWSDWETGLLLGAVPQIPLTLLNSVIAICALSGELYPDKKIPTRRMAASVGLMNIIGCWFGTMPMCHGAGGLAGQHRFGARSGGSVVMLGAAKMAIGVFLGSSAAVILLAYPTSILGVLLCFAGIELALPARNCHSRRDFFLAVLTAGGVLSINTAAGVALGLLAAIIFRNIDNGNDV